MNRDLCLPQVWSADRERRREAGVPEDVCFQTMAQLAQRMLERVADEDVSAGQDDGNTPRYEAVRSDHAGALSVLLDGGADVTAGNDRGMTPLHPAAAHGSQPEFLTLLIDRGAAVDAQTHSGWTPLMHAACCGLPNAMPQEAGTGYSAERNVAIINLLIQRGGGQAGPFLRRADRLRLRGTVQSRHR